MNELIKETRHFGIVVSNLDKSLKFYHDLLGLKILKTMDESGKYIDNMLSLENVQVKTVKLESVNGTTLIELLEYKSPTSTTIDKQIFDIGASHVAFTVNSLDKCYSLLSNSGVKFNSPPQISPDKKAKVAFCFDPDNTPIELVEAL